MLEAEGLGRRGLDGSRWLLSDVSLRVNAREDVAVVGPTGAGKTLLLRSQSLLDARMLDGFPGGAIRGVLGERAYCEPATHGGPMAVRMRARFQDRGRVCGEYSFGNGAERL